MLFHEVTSNEVLNSKFNLLTFRCNKINWNFKIGQFVLIKVGKAVTRAYSIASLPEKLPLWQVFVDLTPGGPGTTYLGALKKGDIIQTTNPTGQFILGEKGKKYLFGTIGCGIAPCIPMIEKVLENKKKAHLFWGLRQEQDIALEDFIERWTKNNNFSYDIVLSKPQSNWKGKTGRIGPLLLSKVHNFGTKETKVYLSGSKDFVKDTSNLLKEGRIPAKKIYFEACY